MQYKISEMGKGDRFSLGGVTWLFLDHEMTGGRALIEDLIGEMAFDEGGNKDWRSSSIKEYMNTDLLAKLLSNGVTKDVLIKSSVNLKALDGSEDYGKDECLLAPLTDEQYSSYKDIIPKSEESWWLITPYSCNEFYIGPIYSQYVRFVRPDSSRDGCLPDAGLLWVRASAVISPNTEVELVSSMIEENIQKIKNYNSPIITTEAGRELAAGLIKLVEETATVCCVIPAVVNSIQNVEGEYAQTDAVSFYEIFKSADLGWTEDRTYISVLGEKLKEEKVIE